MLSISLLNHYQAIIIIRIIVLSLSVSSTSSSSTVGKSMHGGGPMCLVTTYSFTEGFSHSNEELLYSLFTS